MEREYLVVPILLFLLILVDLRKSKVSMIGLFADNVLNNVLLEVDILFNRLINKKILENRKNVILENIDETSVLFLL